MESSYAASFAVRSTTEGRSRPDVFDCIEADHHRLRVLVARLCLNHIAAPDRRRLTDRLSDALEAHSAAAEQCFYAPLMTRAEDQRHARRAVDAHDAAAELIGELAGLEKSGEAWRCGVHRLARHLEKHFRKEEGETIPLAKSLLDGAQAAQLGDRYEQARDHWFEVYGGVPETTGSKPAKHAHVPELSGNLVGNIAGREARSRRRSHATV